MRDPLTRRRLLQHGAMGSLAIYLAACGTDRPEREVQRVERGEIGDSLYFSNWPLYIEEDRGTLEDFEREFGAEVKYVEEINDNQEFFGKVRQQYGQGRSGGRDLHVVTDWMAARMIRLNYVQQLDKSQLPNVQRNLIDRLRDPLFDPKREFSVPWQSGMTGIVYRKDLVKREPKSVADLFDPDYRGKVTMLTELYDTVPMTLLSMDVDPTTAKVDDILAAIEKVGEASDSGQFRGFTGNEYTQGPDQGRLGARARLVG